MCGKMSTTAAAKGDRIIFDDGPGWEALLDRYGLRSGRNDNGVFLSAVLRDRFCKLNGRRDDLDTTPEAHLLRSECGAVWDNIDRGIFGSSAVKGASDLCRYLGKGDPACEIDIASALLLPDETDVTLRSMKTASDDVDTAARACNMSTSGQRWAAARARIDIARTHITHQDRHAGRSAFDRALKLHCQHFRGSTQLYKEIKSAGADDATAVCMLRMLGKPPHRNGAA